ncbi:M23 family metallopeptidase [Blastococcus sp. Marseille-P5729]|uniref:M23 family metallopeptidase n=1 Tax=Blastococcus sp. Marseille-P5729 TaxID=2086582 RepID=UPI001F3DC308|nr:peptidoglycan DD-metalloendopeptidase family protein [Blastococcus sp. Marseille-P5729]
MSWLNSKTALGAACMVVASWLLPAGPAGAVPPSNPSDEQVTDAVEAKEQAAAQVAAASEAVTEMTNEIEALNAQALAAADAYEVAQGQLGQAKDRQASTARTLAAATADVEQAEGAVEDLARGAYVQGNVALTGTVLLTAEGPQDLIDRLTMLAVISEWQDDDLATLMDAKAEQAVADAEAQQAVADTAAAEATAKAALDEMTMKVGAANAELATLQAEKAQLDQQLFAAEQALFELENQQQSYQDWVAQQQAAEDAAANAAASQAAAEAAAAQSGPGPSSAPSGNGSWARPAGGTFTSCFCPRWGTFHYGIDIANKMMTPIYAAGSGTVMKAGSANGFGQAIYIQHDDGYVTVYGHMEALFVSAGQRVSAGQHIAGMGTRGQSTGVHLHFEVSKGMYGTRIDPVPWLAARGIKV